MTSQEEKQISQEEAYQGYNEVSLRKNLNKDQCADSCLSCKIISYTATTALTCTGLIIIKRNPIPGLVLTSFGIFGVGTFLRRDFERYYPIW